MDTSARFRSRLAGATAVALALLPAGRAVAGVALQPPVIGAEVTDFEATSLSGQPLSLMAALAEYRAVVVLFLSTVCPYANYFGDHIRELDERYGPRGVLFVGVNSNSWESRGEVAEHARQRGFAFAMVKDETRALARLLGARATPEAFLIDASGRLRYRGWVKSRQESPDLQRALDAVLEGKPVRRPETKAFGCAVDRD
jgi:peroxiredoxin